MIAIIKYNAGNIGSVQNALDRLGYESVITDDAQEILSADKVIFPGVGHAGRAMDHLRKKGLDKVIKEITTPFLGICLGLQLMCRLSEEGNTECLGIYDAEVKRFPNDEIVPHMGWHEIYLSDTELLKDLSKDPDLYFVHSYFAEVSEDTIAVSKYGQKFSAAMQKGNFYATQFHPEKSASVGEKILKNFLAL